MSFPIPIIDCRLDDARRALDELRDKLSPRGNIVSEAGRQRTVELFGEPLSPQQVVELICSDVQERGLEAVLEYGTKLDGKVLTLETMRVSPDEFAAAHSEANPEYLETVRRIRANVERFQKAVLSQSVEINDGEGAVTYTQLTLQTNYSE